MAYKNIHSNQWKTLTVMLILFVYCLVMPTIKAEIRSRGVNSVNTNTNNKNKLEEQLRKTNTNKPNAATSTTTFETSSSSTSSSSATTSSSTHVNTDFIDKISWKCANNASCLYSLASGIISSYRRGDTVKFGFLDLVKLPTHKTKSNLNSKSSETGRSMSSFVDFISGNAIRIPVGPMVFSVQRAEDDDNYIEVALLKKAKSSTGRVLNI